MAATDALDRVDVQKKVAIVDADVHVVPRSAEEFREFIPEAWRGLGDSELMGAGVYTPPTGLMRKDGTPPTGQPGSDPAFLEQQLFGESGVDYAMLIPLLVRPHAHPEHEAAMASAVNSWQEATWLTKHNREGRYFGSIIVVPREPETAVREIEKWAGHPAFKQVVLTPSVLAPLGEPQFLPVFEAATRNELPVAIHMSARFGMFALTPVGFPSFYFDMRTFHSHVFSAHLTSMVFNGLFERLPGLRVVVVEGGYTWAVPLMWRLDKVWAAMHSETPEVKRRPSEYLKEHVRFTTQPVERAKSPEEFRRVVEWLDGDRTFLFATDYPHWDGDYLPMDVIRDFDDGAKRAILAQNALDLYRLPPTYTPQS